MSNFLQQSGCPTSLTAHGVTVSDGSDQVIEGGVIRRSKRPTVFSRDIRECPIGFKPGIYFEVACRLQPRDVFGSRELSYQDLSEVRLLVEPDGDEIKITDDLLLIAAAVAWIKEKPRRVSEFSELLSLLEGTSYAR